MIAAPRVAHQMHEVDQEIGINRIALFGNPEVGYEIVVFAGEQAYGHQIMFFNTAEEALTAYKAVRQAFAFLSEETFIHEGYYNEG